MGEIAGRLADLCILTSDNPRSENPYSIISEIESGIKRSSESYEIIEDRKEAIYRALDIADSEDVVVIAGKGHESYQIYSDRIISFDDGELVRNYDFSSRR
jgi:UDP-N-acetylmuramoyl-L-alanyl-D-glutamate--2,6-diaminopimelate ligase